MQSRSFDLLGEEVTKLQDREGSIPIRVQNPLSLVLTSAVSSGSRAERRRAPWIAFILIGTIAIIAGLVAHYSTVISPEIRLPEDRHGIINNS